MTAPRRPGMTRVEAAALLGVPVDADRATAHRAYLRLARQVHPDAAPEAVDSSSRFDALSRARAVFDGPAPTRTPPVAVPEARVWTPQPSASIGNALLLLVLLVFLLVALVTLDVAVRSHGFEQSLSSSPVAVGRV